MRTPPAHVDSRPLTERIYAPQWAGPWFLTRWLWVLAAFLEHAWRVTAIEDAYAAPDMVFASGAWRLSDYFFLEPSGGYALWAGTMLGIALVAWGGRATKLGILVFLICGWTLGAYEALNVKAHDRLLVWVSVALFFSPADQRDLAGKYRSPFARYLLIIGFSAIYGSTGMLKAIYEPTWFTDGSVLGLHFLDHNHGSGVIATWLSDKTFLLLPGAAITVLWEMTFPLAVWFRKLNPPYLLVGFLFHFILLMTMQVGPFAFVSTAAYPVLLHPEVARGLYERWLAYRRGAVATEGVVDPVSADPG